MSEERAGDDSSLVETTMLIERLRRASDHQLIFVERRHGGTGVPDIDLYRVERREALERGDIGGPSRGLHGIDIPYRFRMCAIAHLLALMSPVAFLVAMFTVFIRRIQRREIVHCTICGRRHPPVDADDQNLDLMLREYFHSRRLSLRYEETQEHLNALSDLRRTALVRAGIRREMRMLTVTDEYGSVHRFFGNCTSDDLLMVVAVIIDRKLYREFAFMYY